jgi:uncharacterized protein YrrD
MRKVSSMVGLSVISTADGVNMGAVTEVVVDLSQGAIVGLVVDPPPAEKGVMAEDIAVIGPDAVMISDRSKMGPVADMPELTDRRRLSKDKPVAVVTKSGTKLGTLAEIYINPATREVTQYDVSAGSVRDLTDGVLSLPLVSGIVHGPDTVIVPDTLITSLEDQVGGLRGTWAAVSRKLRQDLHRASQQASVLYQRSSESMKEAVEQAKHKSEQVAKTVSDKFEQARQPAEEVVEGAAEEVGDETISAQYRETETEGQSDTHAGDSDASPQEYQETPIEDDVVEQEEDESSEDTQ